jgi:hypothetical protein
MSFTDAKILALPGRWRARARTFLREAHAKPADISEGAKLLTLLPNAAELYRRQIALGLDGAHQQIMLKARLGVTDRRNGQRA